MLDKLIPVLVALFSLLTQHVKAQSGTISVGPLLTCSITTFSCPGVSGCCTIGGCCGSGCCASGYACINEGTPQQACCSSWDTTKCGTVTPPVSRIGGGPDTPFLFIYIISIRRRNSSDKPCVIYSHRAAVLVPARVPEARRARESKTVRGIPSPV